MGTAKWSHFFEDVLTAVTPAAPTLNTSTGTYTIPSRLGVAYYVEGVLKNAGTYPLAVNTSISIVAEATSGYGLQGISSWELSYTSTTTPVATVAPTSVKSTGKYTLPSVTGVIWKVDGVAKNPGTYDSGWKKVVITASPSSSNYKLTGTTSWTIDLTKTTVTATAPIFSSSQYTIPSKAGVSYYVDSTFKKPGVYNSYNKLVAVHAAPSATNYQLSGTKMWVKDYRIAVTPKAPTLNTNQTDVYIPVQANTIYYGPNGALAQGKYHRMSGKVTIEAYENNDSYKMAGTTKWAFTMKALVAPTAPVANATKNTIVIPTKTGVNYYINGVYKKAGTYTYSTAGYITVTAKSSNTASYVLSGTQSWKVVLTKIYVTPTKPTWSTSKKTISIPSRTGVNYYINGVYKKAGTHYVSTKGYVKITTKAVNSAYGLSGTQAWTVVLSKIYVTPTKPTWSTSKKTISIPSRTGVNYYINGVYKKAGTHYVSAKGYVKITTKAVNSAYGLSGTQSWSPVLTKIYVTPTKPTWSASANTIKIPAKTGVKYYVNGVYKKTGTHYFSTKGYIKITTKATNAAYGLSGTQSWTVVLTKISVKPTAPYFSTSGNYVKIPAKSGVKYYVNGSYKKTGTYKYKNGTTLKVTTRASNSAYSLTSTQSWTKRI